jgi:membrane protease YdiL (CAAX protease family)
MSSEAKRLELSSDRALALWEVVSVVISCLIAEWVVLSFAGRSKSIMAIPVVLAFSLMVFSHRVRGETLHDLGFRLDNFLPAVRLLIWPTVGAVFLILLAAWITSGYGFSLRPPRWRHLVVPAWAFFQQYSLQSFINRRAQIACGKGLRSIVLVAVVFSLVHLPNPLLAIVTLVGGLMWAWVYQRQPNIVALALSHAIASLVLALSLPVDLVNSLRVGFKYFG